jgi:tight adherence protein B
VPPDDDGARRVARSVDRVAALCRAGVPAERAWRTVAARDPTLEPLLDAPTIGVGLTATVEPAWRDVAVLWSVAERTGAPSADALGAAASALRQGATTRRAIGVALAGPRASGRVVLGLPVLGVVLGTMLGADSIGVLVGSPVGWACMGAASALVALARAWTVRLVRAATPAPELPGLYAEAWSIGLAGGGSRLDAERSVSAAVGDRAVTDVERAEVADTVALAADAGVPAGALLRALGEDLRNEAAADGLVAAERLAVRLVLPLGVCLLPAFVLVGIVPVVVGILSSTIADLG